MKDKLKDLRMQLYELHSRQSMYVMQYRKPSVEIAQEITVVKAAYAKSMINQIRGVNCNDKH